MEARQKEECTGRIRWLKQSRFLDDAATEENG